MSFGRQAWMTTETAMTRENAFGTIWRGYSGGQQEAIGQKLWLAGGGEKGGKEALDAFLRGDITVEIVVKDTTVLLVDKNGRCIPTNGVTAKVVDANRKFHLVQPKINYGTVLKRVKKYFAPELKFCSAEEFETRTKAILARVDGNKQVKNLKKGVCLPFCLPQLAVADYGTTLEDIFLAAVKRAYQAQFPGRPFTNYRSGDLAGQIAIHEQSRHEQLIDAMSKGSVVGIYYPTALQGFGVEADQQMIEALPPGFLLSGAIDIATAWATYPETLARDGCTPVYDCAALWWRDPVCSLYFKASDGGAVFDNRSLGACDGFSGGVSVLG